MLPSQEFAHDSENKVFYYVNNSKKAYTKISKESNPEVYEFLYHVYCVHWQFISNRASNYKYVESMNEISSY